MLEKMFEPKLGDSFDKVPENQRDQFKPAENGGFVYEEALSKEEAEEEAWDENLSKEAMQYNEYTARDEELNHLINIIEKNEENFFNETVKNSSGELVDDVLDFIEGKDSSYVSNLLKKTNFNYKEILDGQQNNEEKAKIIFQAILKAESYDKAVEENKNNKVEFNGFESDNEISDAKEFVDKMFGKEILEKCLISKIDYMPDKVKVRMKVANYTTDYLLPVEVYCDWERKMPIVSEHKHRAESFNSWNSNFSFSKKYIPLPIRIYSFYGEDPEKIDYLEDVSSQEKMRLYKLGTISHEIAHCMYAYLVDEDKRNEWKKITDEIHNFTVYADSYDGQARYNEFFAEAIRLKTTVPNYLESKFPVVDEFLNKYFHQIGENSGHEDKS